LAQGASVSDLVVIVVYDVFSVADTVSKTSGGSFDSAVTMSNNLTVSGAFTSQGIDDNADATAITINSSEQVGIGTTSPSYKLTINSADEDHLRFENGSELAFIRLTDAGILDLWSHGTDEITFSNGTGSGTERMRINSDGNFFVGTTSTSPNPGFVAVATGQIGIGKNNSNSGNSFIEFRRNASQIGSVTQSGTTGIAYNTSSDYRLKESVTYDFDATTRLKQLKPCRFNFIADSDTTVDGFLAHEVQSVVPEAITGTHNEVDDDGNAVMQGIDQSKLVPLLVKTIQELEARITALESA
jgi:hypothetical protein